MSSSVRTSTIQGLAQYTIQPTLIRPLQRNTVYKRVDKIIHLNNFNIKINIGGKWHPNINKIVRYWF